MNLQLIVSVVAVAASVAALVLAVRLWKSGNASGRGNPERQMAQPSNEQSREHMRQLLLAAQRLERQVDHLGKRIARMEHKLERVTAVQLPSLPLDKAVRLAQSGASTAELAKCCGLNDGEAMLMRKMHSGAQAAQTVS